MPFLASRPRSTRGLAALLHTSAVAPRWQMLHRSAVSVLVTLVALAGYEWGAGAVRTHVLSRPRVLARLRRTFAVAFVALGATLATAER